MTTREYFWMRLHAICSEAEEFDYIDTVTGVKYGFHNSVRVGSDVLLPDTGTTEGC